MAVPRRPADEGFGGSNPGKDTFNGSCAENLGCSVALARRFGLRSTAELKSLCSS